MTTRLFANDASSLLAVSISGASTSIQVGAGDGTKFPTPTAGQSFVLTLQDASGDIERILCTARSGDVITASTRGYDGTVARAWTNGVTRVEFRLSRADLDRLVQHDAGVVSRDLTINNLTVTGSLTQPGGVGWNAGNDGSGSGLDADLLDGQHASSFAPVVHTHSLSSLAGTVADAQVPFSAVQQHQGSLQIAEGQIPDGTILSRNAANETISGAWNFSQAPKRTGQGGYASFEDAANTAPVIRVSTLDPSGTPGNGDLWLKREV